MKSLLLSLSAIVVVLGLSACNSCGVNGQRCTSTFVYTQQGPGQWVAVETRNP